MFLAVAPDLTDINFDRNPSTNQPDIHMEYAVIMAGGRGTRLWPFSRNDRPKQLLPIVRGKSLLQLSYERLRALLPAAQIYVCTSASQRDAILANLPELPPHNVLGEPEGRDTANAV